MIVIAILREFFICKFENIVTGNIARTKSVNADQALHLKHMYQFGGV